MNGFGKNRLPSRLQAVVGFHTYARGDKYRAASSLFRAISFISVVMVEAGFSPAQ